MKIKIKGVLNWTIGQQGGVGYPPLLVKIGKGKWLWVEGSRDHGGVICGKCSEEFGREVACIREAVPLLTRQNLKVGDWEYITWEEFKVMVKEQFGINGESNLTPDELAVKKCLEARLSLYELRRAIDLHVEYEKKIDEVVEMLRRLSQECYRGKFKVRIKNKTRR
jgi:hypothetical protein